MSSLIDLLKTPAGRLQATRGAVMDEVARLRDRLKATGKALRQAERAPVPLDEMHQRIPAVVADRGAYWLRTHGHALIEGPGGLALRALGTYGTKGRIVLPDGLEHDLFGALCAGDPPAAERLLIGLVARVPSKAGGPSSERPQLLSRLRDELAALDATEEQAVDAAEEAGLGIGHRPEVIQRRAAIQRREDARRRRELADQAASHADLDR